mmetsp:Transcript_164051/g.290461  ORF Transcript_164051/g.290461 Transcript_164051/m.290461 type:complete len:228 (+) Transcript_164051:682-1365(+)
MLRTTIHWTCRGPCSGGGLAVDAAHMPVCHCGSKSSSGRRETSTNKSHPTLHNLLLEYIVVHGLLLRPDGGGWSVGGRISRLGCCGCMSKGSTGCGRWSWRLSRPNLKLREEAATDGVVNQALHVLQRAEIHAVGTAQAHVHLEPLCESHALRRRQGSVQTPMQQDSREHELVKLTIICHMLHQIQALYLLLLLFDMQMLWVVLQSLMLSPPDLRNTLKQPIDLLHV